MGHNLYKKTVLFIGAIALSGAVFSASIENDGLAQECKYLGASLSQLAKANNKEHCSVDVSYSGVMMEQTASLIIADRIKFAIDNLSLVHRTLERVGSNPWECQYFSSMVRPYVEKAEHLLSKLERLPEILTK